MKVAILAPSPVPFAQGGAEAVWNGLLRELTEHSAHDAELLKLPVRERSLPDLMASYEAFSRLDLSHFDVVITGKYPAWMVRHPRHVVYMLHPLRGLYDTYDSFGLTTTTNPGDPVLRRLLHVAEALSRREHVDGLFEAWRAALAALGPDDPAFAFPGPVARALVHALDQVALSADEVSRHFAISRTVARRRDYFPKGVRATVVHPPSDLVGLRGGGDDYFFTASRLDGPKRLQLLVQAMRHVPGDVALKIAGTGPLHEELQLLAAEDARVQLLGYVTREELVDLYANALAVPFVPLDEDLGLITLEAMAARKPVITCADSGGPTEFVQDGVTGLVVPPSAPALGAAMTTLHKDRAYARRLGESAARRASEVTWSRVTGSLLSAGRTAAGPSPSAGRTRGRPRLVVVSTFPLTPAQGGGQLRCVNLYGGLLEHYDVEAVCLSGGGHAVTKQLRPGFVEHVVPVSSAHGAAEAAETAKVGLPITDIVAGRLVRLTPDYGKALAAAADGAAAVILAHPFLHPEVRRVAPHLPVVYDAHNCEAVLKSAMLPPGRHGDRLRQVVLDVEGEAVAAARLVAVVSPEDEAALRAAYPAARTPFVTVPNGVDVSRTPFTEGSVRRANRARYLDRLRSAGGAGSTRRIALFIGSWHQPNIDAGLFLIRMASALPEVLFLLVGGHCRAIRGVRLPANVVLMDVVGDSTKGLLLRSADVALNPVVTGSGTNLKLVEYAAAGVPVVSTPTGVRGLAFGPGEVRTAELDGFAAAVHEVLSNEADSDAAARGARESVVRTYDWPVISRQLLDGVRGALVD